MGFLLKTLRNKVIFFIFAGIFVNIPNLPPDSIFEEHRFKPPPPFEGPLAVNDALDGGEILFENEMYGPEGLTVHKGVLYTGLMDGRIMALKNNKIVTVANLRRPCDDEWDLSKCGGHLLGLKFDKAGNLFVVDSYFGIYKVNITTGASSLVIPSSTPIDGQPSAFVDDLDVGSDGSIYWSDASSKFPFHRLMLSALGDNTGRLIKTNLNTGRSEVLVGNLRFADGVFLADDESYVLVGETFAYRVHRYWLKGPKKGKTEIYLDNLPGIPDTFTAQKNGGFVLNIMMTRESPDLLGALAAYPNVRKFCARALVAIELLLQKLRDVYPTNALKKAAHYVTHFYTTKTLFIHNKHYIALYYDRNGKLIKSLHSTDGSMSFSSVIIELGDYYYLASPTYLRRKKISK